MMLEEFRKKCPVCEGVLMEVNYVENSNNLEYASYVLVDGARIQGKIKKFVCTQCLGIQSFLILP